MSTTNSDFLPSEEVIRKLREVDLEAHEWFLDVVASFFYDRPEANIILSTFQTQWSHSTESLTDILGFTTNEPDLHLDDLLASCFDKLAGDGWLHKTRTNNTVKYYIDPHKFIYEFIRNYYTRIEEMSLVPVTTTTTTSATVPSATTTTPPTTTTSGGGGQKPTFQCRECNHLFTDYELRDGEGRCPDCHCDSLERYEHQTVPETWEQNQCAIFISELDGFVTRAYSLLDQYVAVGVLGPEHKYLIDILRGAPSSKKTAVLAAAAAATTTPPTAPLPSEEGSSAAAAAATIIPSLPTSVPFPTKFPKKQKKSRKVIDAAKAKVKKNQQMKAALALASSGWKESVKVVFQADDEESHRNRLKPLPTFLQHSEMNNRVHPPPPPTTTTLPSSSSTITSTIAK